jgi:hypothetical protein
MVAFVIKKLGRAPAVLGSPRRPRGWRLSDGGYRSVRAVALFLSWRRARPVEPSDALPPTVAFDPLCYQAIFCSRKIHCHRFSTQNRSDISMEHSTPSWEPPSSHRSPTGPATAVAPSGQALGLTRGHGSNDRGPESYLPTHLPDRLGCLAISGRVHVTGAIERRLRRSPAFLCFHRAFKINPGEAAAATVSSLRIRFW